MIVRTPFGVSNAQLASRLYAGDSWGECRATMNGEHLAAVSASIKELPGPLLGVNSGYREDHGSDFDGRKAEWWSVISYDGPTEAPS